MKSKNIGIIENSYSNLSSVINVLKFLEVRFKVLNKPHNINKYTHLILPGVGSFKKVANSLKKNGWFKAIHQHVKKKPLLGICLGMQLLFSESSEEGNTKGLNLIKGNCKKFDINSKKTFSTHIGFNTVLYKKKTKIWKDIPNCTPFYFVHNYRIKKTHQNINYSYTKHFEKFISFVEKKNIIGVQFHPEKSHKYGLQLIKNFIQEY